MYHHKPHLIGAFLLALLWMGTASPVQSQVTYTLTTTDDLRLGSYAPSTNLYGDGYLSVYNDGANNQHSLLKFDLSSIIGDVTSATLTLTVRPQFSGNGQPAYIYRATRDWTATQASWNNADS